MLKAEDLAEMSINDLNLLASSKQIALSNTTTTGSASESGYIGTARGRGNRPGTCRDHLG